MNFKNILSEIEKADPEVFERLSDRRGVLKSFGAKVAVAALPVALGSLFNKAYGKTSSAVVDVLNFALELEYLEYNLYHTANNVGAPLIPGSDQPGFTTVENQEKAHITFLNQTIIAAGGTPFTPKTYSSTATNPFFVPFAYDFTAGGTYATFDTYANFLIIAQILEDTGERALKGQIPSAFGNATLLTQLMQLQCTEGRHAAFVRTVRRLLPITDAPEYPAPWITNNVPPTIPLQPYYLGEDNVTQLFGVTITNLPDAYASGGTVPKLSATAAFDEPWDIATTQKLIAPFLL